MYSDDYIEIRNIGVDTFIGVHTYERHIGQRLLIHVRFGVDIRRAAACDQLADAVDYQQLVEHIVAYVQKSRVQLLETLAEQLAAHLFDMAPLPWVHLELLKPHIFPSPMQVGLVIKRYRTLLQTSSHKPDGQGNGDSGNED